MCTDVGMKPSSANSPKLFLASASPRRQELLTQIGVEFTVAPQNIDESPLVNETPRSLVCRLSREKAVACLQQRGDDAVIALGSDTIVVHDSKVMGQPANRQDAMEMLLRLSDSQHQVLTAVTLASDSLIETRLSTTRVQFRPITLAEAEAYWDTGEPRDKAGGYAIQGHAAVFVEYIEGSYSGVMGLPLFETAQLLQQFGLPCWHQSQKLEKHPG